LLLGPAPVGRRWLSAARLFAAWRWLPRPLAPPLAYCPACPRFRPAPLAGLGLPPFWLLAGWAWPCRGWGLLPLSHGGFRFPLPFLAPCVLPFWPGLARASAPVFLSFCVWLLAVIFLSALGLLLPYVWLARLAPWSAGRVLAPTTAAASAARAYCPRVERARAARFFWR